MSTTKGREFWIILWILSCYHIPNSSATGVLCGIWSQKVYTEDDSVDCGEKPPSNDVFGNVEMTERYIVPSSTVPSTVFDRPSQRPVNSGPTTASVNLPVPPACGTFPDSRLNERQVTLTDFPWTVVFRYNTDKQERVSACSGVLISSRFVLTAASCVSKIEHRKNRVKLESIYVGDHNVGTDPDCFGTFCSSLQKLKVSRHFVHTSEQDANVNDVALVELDKDVQFSDFAKPICLPNAVDGFADNLDNQKLFASGWQKTFQYTAGEKIKQFAELLEVPLASCKNFENGLRVDSSNAICVGSSSSKSRCDGFEGAPLVVKSGGSWTLIGVAPDKITCSASNAGAFMRISNLQNWISSIIAST